MKCRTIRLQEVKDSLRFDGSFHNAEINIYDYVIRQHSSHLLSFFCDGIFTSSRGRRCYTKKKYGYPFLSNSDMIALNPFVSCKYSSKKYGLCEDALLKEGMVLTGRVGAIGQTAFVPKFWERCNTMGSDNIIRIVTKKEIRSGFIYAYLSSKMGYLSFWKYATGGVQPYITPGMVANLPIPDFTTKFQEKVDNLIKESARLREEANRFLNDAVSEFEKCLNPVCYKREFCTSTVSTKQILKKFNRLDSHYQIAQKEFVKRRKKGLKYEKIGPKAEKIFVGNRGKRLYSKDGIPFLSSSDMMLFNALRYSKIISVNTPSLKMMQVHKNEILISRSGTVGNSILIGGLLNEKAVSEHALRLVLDEQKVNPSYVFAYLNTEEGRELLQSLAYGSVIVTLGEDFVADIDLPILDEQIQRKIVKKINEYVRLSDSAVEKESLAISMVEKEIDGWNA